MKIGEEKLSAKRRELDREESELNRATGKLNLLKDNPSSSGSVQKLKLKIIDLIENVNILENELDKMEQLRWRKVSIIEEERDLMEEIIREEDSSTKLNVQSDDVKKNTAKWIANQSKQHYEEIEDSSYTNVK